MDDIMVAAQEYGIELRDLAVIDRKFKGEVMISIVCAILMVDILKDCCHHG